MSSKKINEFITIFKNFISFLIQHEEDLDRRKFIINYQSKINLMCDNFATLVFNEGGKYFWKFKEHIINRNLLFFKTRTLLKSITKQQLEEFKEIKELIEFVDGFSNEIKLYGIDEMRKMLDIYIEVQNIL